jgi:hypothetical protein
VLVGLSGSPAGAWINSGRRRAEPQWVSACIPAGPDAQPPLGMIVSPYGSGSILGRAWIATKIPTEQVPTMRRNPLLNFQVTAERAGYPALLIVSLVCLGLVVIPVSLLALTQAAWSWH